MLFMVLAFVALFGQSISSDECEKPNEVFSQCAPDIELTCENWVHPPPGYDKNCHEACTCKKDHVRDPEGNCVPKHRCPIPCECKENEVFKQREEHFISCQYPNISLALEKPFCYCIKGFIYDYDSQKCVKLNECPCPGINQIFSECVPNIPKTCNHRSNDPKYLACNPGSVGCICQPGFVLNDYNICIDSKTCPPTPCQVKCKANNQEYVGCVKNVQCSIEQPPIGACKKGCQCPEGTVKLLNGKCGPPEDCKVCPKNSAFSLQVSQCERSCSNRFIKIKCVDIYKPGCKCDEGFVLNSKNQCIKEEDCKDNDVICPGNLIFKSKGALKTCDQHHDKPSKNVKVEPGCVCPDGMLFDLILGKCVPTDECPNSNPNTECQKQDPNKVFKTCQLDLPTCKDPTPSYCKPVCQRGCFCKQGYVQISETNTKCVKVNQCICPPNSKFSECASVCPSTCENYYQPPKPCPLVCKQSCQCNPGYVLNSQKLCVKVDQCKPTEIKCSNNRVFGNSGILISCEHLNSTLPKILGEKGCYCPMGLYYNILIDRCVEKDECPASVQNQKCALSDPNKEFKKCQSSSCIKTCENPNPTVCTRDCRTGCFCKDGLVQKSIADRTCVPLNECPLKCKSNEVLTDCGSLCPKTCKNLYQNVMCATVCDNILKCQCSPGYVLNDKNLCVLPTECKPEEIKCPVNQEYKPNGVDRFCPGCKYILPNYIKPRPGCFCSPGFLLDKDLSTCIPEDECPHSLQNKQCKLKDPSSSFKQCIPCAKTCSNKFPICTAVCTPGCVCDKGLILDKPGGKCIPESQCPTTCPDHSTPVQCQNLCAKSCANLYDTKPPVCTKICINGCDCDDGYYKNSENQCVKPELCKPSEIVCSAGMYYTKSMPKDTKTCDNIDEELDLTPTTKKGCTCKDNLVLNEETGTCILPNLCPNSDKNLKCQENDPNSQYFQCKPCSRTCTDKNPICPLICKPGCGCKKGHVLSKTGGTCVPIDECPLTPDCGPNATFRDYQNTCGRTCRTYYLAPYIKCPILNVPGCDCNTPYVKNDLGECVLIEDCDPKEVQCPGGLKYKESDDPRTCEDVKNDSPKTVKGCFCMKPYVLDTITNACVLPEECTNSPQDQKCQRKDPNSVYNSCIWRRPTCLDINPQALLPHCVPGCDCKPGYVLDNRGKCIESEQCPKVCPPNSIYTNLVNECGRTCSTMFLKAFILCIKPHAPGCECLPGFVRNSKNQCVHPLDCLPQEVVCPPSTHYDLTSNGKTCQGLHSPRVGILPPKLPPKSCICNHPLVLDEISQRCIDPKQCANSQENQACTKKDPNSEFHSCQLFSNPTCKIPLPTISSGVCQSGCFCKPGYVQNNNGLCVLLNQCDDTSTQCRANQILKECGLCGQKTCENMFSKIQYHCTLCKPGCACRPGFVLDKNLKCIHPALCPTSDIKCPPNQVYLYNGWLKTCDNLDGKTLRGPGCYCKPPLVLGPTGLCVTVQECHSSIENTVCASRDPNSEFKACAPRFDGTCEYPYPTQPIIKECHRKCVCKQGFVLKELPNGLYICIPLAKCNLPLY